MDYTKEDLVSLLQKAGRQNATDFFSCALKLLSQLSINKDDVRVTFGASHNNKLRITIGKRACLTLHPGRDKPWRFISSQKLNDIPSVELSEVFDGTPVAYYWKCSNFQVLQNHYNDIFNASKIELERTSISGYRDSNNSILEKAIFDENYRKELFDLAFKNPIPKTDLITIEDVSIKDEFIKWYMPKGLYKNVFSSNEKLGEELSEYLQFFNRDIYEVSASDYHEVIQLIEDTRKNNQDFILYSLKMANGRPAAVLGHYINFLKEYFSDESAGVSKRVTLFDWVPFFRELSEKLVEIGKLPDRDSIMHDKAVKCFGANSPIAKYTVDPLSFIYCLASKEKGVRRTNSNPPIYSNIKKEFSLESPLPTDWVYPTPSGVNVLFHNGVIFKTDQIWNLFTGAFSRNISGLDFEAVLKIPQVDVSKLTQVLFLVNPKYFIPVDDQLDILIDNLDMGYKNLNQLKYEIRGDGIKGLVAYQYFMSRIPIYPIEYYRLNFFLGQVKEGLKISERIFQISTNKYDDGDDYYEEFRNENTVKTGGATSKTKSYDLFSPEKGDIIVIRKGNFNVKAIAIVWENEYKIENKWTPDIGIKVIILWEGDRINSGQFPQLALSRCYNLSKEKFSTLFHLLSSIAGFSIGISQISGDNVKNLILQGAPGTGKTRLAKQLAVYLQTHNSSVTEFLLNKDIREKYSIFNEEPEIENYSEQIQLVQFHPGYTYEDFVRGISTDVNDTNQVKYKVQDKILMNIVKKATEDMSNKYVLIIDEMNRANLPSVLGELIYALEYRGERVEGIYIDSETGSTEIIIPDNLYIIGTMNTADRSIGHIDYAIRRRFVFKDVLSDPKYASQSPVAQKLYSDIESFFNSDVILSPDFKKNDVMLGHSYFITGKRTIQQRLEFEIKPLLREYVKDGILIGEDITKKIEDLTA